MKRILALLLLLCMCLPLVACGGSGDTGGTGDDEGKDNYTFIDTIGDLNFDGAEFVVSLLPAYEHELYKEEREPDAYNKATEDRNRFNVEIVPDMVAGQNAIDHANEIRMAMMDGNPDEIDMVLIQRWLVGPVIMTQTLYDLRTEVPYVKDSIGVNAWWNPKMNDCYTVFGHQFVGVSDLNTTALSDTWAIIFNRDLDKDYALSTHKKIDSTYNSLYDAVDAKTWTLENMNAIVKDFFIDNPATGEIGTADVNDKYGLTAAGSWCREIFTDAFGYDLLVNNGTDIPTLAAFTNSMATNVTTVRDMFATKGFNTFKSDNWAMNFANGLSLLFMTTIATLDSDTIHESDVEFGVLPFPLANENQKEYYAGTQDAMSTIIVPLNVNTRLQCTGAMIEAMSAESHQSVLPAYYEVILKYNATRDEDSVRMIEKIYECRRYNLAGIHSSKADDLFCDSEATGLAYIFRKMTSSQENPADIWERVRDSYTEGLDDLVMAYDQLASMY